MTSDEIKYAIERLHGLDTYEMTTGEVVAEFMGMCDNDPYFTLALRNRLVGLLRQADPDTHVELPRDVNGTPIHVGDLLEYLGFNDVWGTPFAVDELWLCRNGWKVYNTRAFDRLSERCRHSHALTVEGILHEFIEEWNEADSEGDIFDKYAARLREVMQDD